MISWQKFYDEFLNFDYIYEFLYKDNLYLYIGNDYQGIIFKKRYWFFIVHRHDNKGNLIEEKYKTPKELLDNACIDGKSLKDIWNDLSLA